MTRRKIIFYNDLSNRYIVSEEYNGDKTEMEKFGLGSCDHTWQEFMDAMMGVDNLADFLKVISWVTNSYHATVNGTPLSQQSHELPGSRLNVAHSNRELYTLVFSVDEVWEVKRGIPEVHLFDTAAIAPITWNGKDVVDTDEFNYSTAKPGDYVTQSVRTVPKLANRTPSGMTGELESIGTPTVPYEIWEYCGHCSHEETEERGTDISVVEELYGWVKMGNQINMDLVYNRSNGEEVSFPVRNVYQAMQLAEDIIESDDCNDHIEWTAFDLILSRNEELLEPWKSEDGQDFAEFWENHMHDYY